MADDAMILRDRHAIVTGAGSGIGTAAIQLAKDAGVKQLSMGMSSDYPTAILLGATHVRVGSAIFGVRG